MAKVTVGIPVYNGEAQLEECLNCILDQTLQDIEVIIGDNASTDRTAEIAKAFAARDGRIRYIRREVNKGPMPNFIALTREATSPYFIWRAHDDLSSSNYLEELYEKIIADERADLAIPTVKTTEVFGSRVRIAAPEIFSDSGNLVAISRLMFESHAGWYYGMWKTDVVRRSVQRTWELFPHAWASDHLALYPILLSRAIVAAPSATFQQRITPKSPSRARGIRMPLGEMFQLRRVFFNSCNILLKERNFPLLTSSVISVLNWFYTGQRVFRITKLMRAFSRKIVGKS